MEQAMDSIEEVMTPQSPAQDAEWVEDIGLVDALFDEEPKYALCLRTRAAYQIKRDRTRLAALTAELARVNRVMDLATEAANVQLDRAESAERKLAQAMRVVEAGEKYINERNDTPFTVEELKYNDALRQEYVISRAALSDMDKGQG